ncbi:MAG: hypothetical protein GX167_09705 [Firmicutes bacterium]|jgi:hypothetical protein|nr:hypothetical protein [Bacillota bacterium]
MKSIVFAVLTVATVILTLLQKWFHLQKIKARVLSLGGTVLRVEKKKIGPFVGIRKSQTVYKFIYEEKGRIYVGWVKFGALPHADWLLQSKEEQYEVLAGKL